MDQKTVVCIFNINDEREPEERLALAARRAFGSTRRRSPGNCSGGKRGSPFSFIIRSCFCPSATAAPTGSAALSGERSAWISRRGPGSGGRAGRRRRRGFPGWQSAILNRRRAITWRTEGGHPYQRFFEIWAAKESYVKYTGQGIDGSFGQFSTAPEDGNIIRNRLPWTAEGVWFWKEDIGENYVLCVCTRKEKPVQVEWITD